jgi:hypothetical protein
VYGTTLQDLLGTLGVTLSLCSAMTVATLFWPQRQSFSEKQPSDTSPNDSSPPSALVLVSASIYCFATLLFAGLYGWHDPWQFGGVIAIIVVAVSIWPWARSSGVSEINYSQHDSVEQSKK